MAEIITSSPEPAYLSRLGLRQMPFARVDRPEAFFPGQQILASRNLLLHLLRSTQQSVVVQAPAGRGKTTLLHSLLATSQPELRFCLVEPGITPTQLLRQLSQSLAINPGAIEGDSFEDLTRLLPQLQSLRLKPVLLVDDVAQLPSDLLTILLDLAGRQHQGKALIQLVVSCEALPQSLQQSSQFSQIVSLAALEPQEIGSYLQHRLHAAGYQGESLFTDKVLQQFYKQSAGNMAELNQLANQFLLREKKKAFPEFHLLRLSWKHLQLIAGVIALCAVVLILINQQAINDWMSGQPEKQVSAETPLLTESDSEVVTVDVSEPKMLDTKEESRKELAALLAEIDAESAQLSAASEAEALITPQEEVVTPPPAPAVHDQAWVMAQSASSYTFQLKGAWDEAEIDAYIVQYALSGDVAKFTSLRNDKPWHVLIYGVYKNKQAAIEANNHWPAPLNTSPTWLRRFDSVQKQINTRGLTPE